MNATTSEQLSPTVSKLLQPLIVMSEMIRPRKRVSCGEWAELYRVLPPGSPLPGAWRNANAPYLLTPWEACDDVRTRFVTLCVASQMGKTEFAFVLIGKRFHIGPLSPAIYIAPTQKLCNSISKARIGPMLRQTKPLADRLARGHADSTYEKTVAGMRLGFAWANSATELASHPSGLIVQDECDNMPTDVDGQGDPGSIASARMKNFRHGTHVKIGSPTTNSDGTIWAALEAGSLEKYAWVCKECDELFVPRFELFTPDLQRPSLACPHCGAAHFERDKLERNQPSEGARYIPHRVTEDGEHQVDDADPTGRIERSFWVSGLCSTMTDWRLISTQWHKAEGNPSLEMPFYNTMVGEPYDVPGERPEYDHVLTLVRDYPEESMPAPAQRLTAGIDVQKNGLWFVLRAWGFQAESWLVRYGHLFGNTAYDDVWIRLFNVLSKTYGQRTVDVAFVDSGYKPGADERDDHKVYEICRRWSGIFATKGHAMQSRPIRESTLREEGITLMHIDSDYFKSWLYKRMAWDTDEPGGWYLHAGIAGDHDYAKQVTSEQRTVVAGKVRWIKKHPQNHLLDCEALAAAAAHHIGVEDLPELEAAERRPAPAPAPAAQPRTPAAPAPAPRRGGLLDGLRPGGILEGLRR